jgi:hypothetical protein
LLARCSHAAVEAYVNQRVAGTGRVVGKGLCPARDALTPNQAKQSIKKRQPESRRFHSFKHPGKDALNRYQPK